MRFTSLVLAVLAGCAMQTPSTPAVSDASAADRTFALADYQRAVKFSLKTPATARFERDPLVFLNSHGQLQAGGSVDAQNMAGALVRSSYDVVWSKAAEGYWSVDHVSITPPR